MRKTVWRFGAIGALALASAIATSGAAGAGGGPSVRVVANHLNNPRGVSILNDGTSVVVTEAGRGGLTDHSRCDNVIDPESGETVLGCLSYTGAVTEVQGSHVWRPIQGLPSVGDESGMGTSGPSDAVDAGAGHLAIIVQGVGETHPRVWDPAARNIMGHLLDNKTPSIDIARYEKVHDPDHQGVDSDPYALAANPTTIGGVVADAGANDLLAVDGSGHISVLAVFPNRMVANPFGPGMIPQQAVPTSVVLGPDGAWYVGELTGFPFTVGTARIWRVVPGQAATVYKDGFTNITGLAFGPDGALYVSEIAKDSLLSPDPSGGLFKIWHGTVSEIPVPGLILAGGVAVAHDGTIYQANCSIFTSEAHPPCAGQLLAINQ